MTKTASMIVQLQSKVSTGALPGERISFGGRDSEVAGSWSEVADLLVEWWGEAGFTDSDGLMYPTEAAIESASRLINRMKSVNYPAPLRVVGDGEGGIVFEHVGPVIAETFRIDEHGAVEYLHFANSRLVARTPMPLAD
jgi:hypothetical protein